MFEFVRSSNIEDKRRYTNLVKAQLSGDELGLLFCHCLSSHGETFKPLVEEFSLLENIDKSRLLDSAHEKFYNKDAFNEVNEI